MVSGVSLRRWCITWSAGEPVELARWMSAVSHEDSSRRSNDRNGGISRCDERSAQASVVCREIAEIPARFGYAAHRPDPASVRRSFYVKPFRKIVPASDHRAQASCDPHTAIHGTSFSEDRAAAKTKIGFPSASPSFPWSAALPARIRISELGRF